MVYLITGTLSMIAQRFIFRMQAVRKAFNIPIVFLRMRIKPPTFFFEAAVIFTGLVAEKKFECRLLATDKDLVLSIASTCKLL